jgi:beta-glucosidase
MAMEGFPDGFMWGTGASSLQTEGAPPSSDWWAWEEAGRAPRSGDGNGFAVDFADDLRRFAELGLTHHRLSFDWARLEPQQGRHDAGAVEHYREILTAARDADVSVWACLHHFDLPRWFADGEGGFVDERARTLHWARHVDWIGETFGDLVHGWKPINEPVAYAMLGWLNGRIPPGRSDFGAFAEALEAVLLANHDAWRLLRSGDQPTCTIHSLMPVYPVWSGADDGQEALARDNARIVDDVVWRSWIRAMRDGVLAVPGRAEREVPDMAGSFDLIGFSYYYALGVGADFSTQPYPTGSKVGPLGLAPWAEGLRVCLERVGEELPDRPIVIAECGLGTWTADDDDAWRCQYLEDCLEITRDAIAGGIDVRGFFHWTGVDNYEWNLGYDAAFGLFDRDRTAKASADVARRWATGA